MKFYYVKNTLSAYVPITAVGCLLCIVSACFPTKLVSPDTHISMELNVLDVNDQKNPEKEIMSVVPIKDLYVYFISTSEEYSNEIANIALQSLRDNFYNFGRDIGNNNVAIWVNEIQSTRLSARLGKLIADRYRLYSFSDFDYSDGPFVIVSNVHPRDALDFKFEPLANSELASDEKFAIGISFNGISSRYVIDAMNYLEQGIRRNELNSSKALLIETWFNFQSWFSMHQSDVVDFLKDSWFIVLRNAKK